MDRLFVGSKSEGLYPVLHAEDGQQYRLHYRGDISLNEKTLSELEYKKYILKEYTFLKRPVMLFNNQIFIGNAPKTVAAAKVFLQKK